MMERVKKAVMRYALRTANAHILNTPDVQEAMRLHSRLMAKRRDGAIEIHHYVLFLSVLYLAMKHFRKYGLILNDDVRHMLLQNLMSAQTGNIVDPSYAEAASEVFRHVDLHQRPFDTLLNHFIIHNHVELGNLDIDDVDAFYRGMDTYEMLYSTGILFGDVSKVVNLDQAAIDYNISLIQQRYKGVNFPNITTEATDM